MNDLLGKNSSELLESLNSKPVTAIRMHPRKGRSELSGLNRIPWSSLGYYLGERPSFVRDPHFHAGSYYVQDAASQFIEYLFNKLKWTTKHPMILDLSAAPGGKSTHLLSLMEGKGLLLANEVNRKRYQILNENLIKWGFDNYLSTSLDPSRISRLGGLFDLVLLDAPCSGEGLFRKDRNARKEWSVANVNLCCERQSRILHEAKKLVKTGGYLIYSTCTFNSMENEEQLDILLNNGFDWPDMDTDDARNWNVSLTRPAAFRFYPHLQESEGFFAAVLQRKEENSERTVTAIHNISGNLRQDSDKFRKQISPFVRGLDDRFFLRFKRSWSSLPKAVIDSALQIIAHIPVYKSGADLGTFKGDSFVPAHELAMRFDLNRSFPVLEVDRDVAIQFLAKQAIQLSSKEKGWALISFEGSILGWVKVLQGRVNNYFPTAFRLRKF